MGLGGPANPADVVPSEVRFRVGAAFGDDLVAEVDALVADVHVALVGCDEHFNLLAVFSAERAREFCLRPWMYMHGISLACPSVSDSNHQGLPAPRPPTRPPDQNTPNSLGVQGVLDVLRHHNGEVFTFGDGLRERSLAGGLTTG